MSDTASSSTPLSMAAASPCLEARRLTSPSTMAFLKAIRPVHLDERQGNLTVSMSCLEARWRAHFPGKAHSYGRSAYLSLTLYPRRFESNCFTQTPELHASY